MQTPYRVVPERERLGLAGAESGVRKSVFVIEQDNASAQCSDRIGEENAAFAGKCIKPALAQYGGIAPAAPESSSCYEPDTLARLSEAAVSVVSAAEMSSP